MVSLFQKKHIVRRFSPQTIVKGHATSTYEDYYTVLNVQPLTPTTQQTDPDGERQSRGLKTFGDMLFQTADQTTGTLGDWLYYQGRWYACVSSVLWDHTVLHHCRGEFTQVPETESPTMIAPVDMALLEEWKGHPKEEHKRPPKDEGKP